MSSETSLVLFKPDAIKKNLAGAVLARFQEQGFTVRGIKMMRLSDEILAEHPDLEAEDVAECLRYAALAVQERELPPRQSA